MKLIIFLLFHLISLGLAHASVVIDRTRIVYPADKGDVSVHLSNEGVGNEAVLVQAWIDEVSPDNGNDAPFVISPPMFRIEPKKAQNLRIFFSHERELSNTQESLFWFNINEIPALAKKQIDENAIQFSIHSKIKIFFRPSGLKGDPRDAPALINWKLNQDQLHAENPTPYYITLSSLFICTSGKCVEDKMGGMISPFSNKDFTMLKKEGDPPYNAKDGELTYQFIDDFGAVVPGTISIINQK